MIHIGKDPESGEEKRTAARKASHDDWLAAVEHWAWSRRVEEFFADVDQRMETESPEDRVELQERAALARAMIGEVNALQRLRAWRSPEEIYPQTDQTT